MGEQFVKVPNIDLASKGLEMRDLVIYAYLKKHYNQVTKDSFQLLAEESGTYCCVSSSRVYNH